MSGEWVGLLHCTAMVNWIPNQVYTFVMLRTPLTQTTVGVTSFSGLAHTSQSQIFSDQFIYNLS